MLMGSYDLNGKTERLPRGTTAANLAERIPAGATNVKTAEANNRNEIFVTVGEPTTTLFKPTGKGIELARTGDPHVDPVPPSRRPARRGADSLAAG